MGKSKKVTVGYHYEVALHDGLCLGPLDAFLEFRPGTKTAWAGRITASTTININQPDLWGGKKDQGGVVGPLAVMFGEAGQLPNAYLTGVFGNQTVAWRGIATVALEGARYGANNPWPQKRAYKVERIKQGWDDGCWYPTKAAVPVLSGYESQGQALVQTATYSRTTGNVYHFVAPADVAGWSPLETAYTTEPCGQMAIWPSTVSGEVGLSWVHFFAPTGLMGPVTLNIDVSFNDSGRPIGVGGAELLSWIETGPSGKPSSAGRAVLRIAKAVGPVSVWACFACVDGIDLNTGNPQGSANPADPAGHQAFMAPSVSAAGEVGVVGENPAHAIVWAHTQEHCGAQPLATVNAASAQAAADWFYAQGFGICTLRYPDKESAAEFIRRIERVAGCSWTQNRADGQWYIDIANGQYTLADLPILNDDDIVAFEEVPTVLDEAVNSVSVKYFDPQRKEAITTPPLRAMGLVAEFGTIHQTYEFPELPTDALANRVANRELLARCTPTRVFNLVTTRKTAGWRRNTYFRLQSPKRGIADMVCLLAEVNDGSLKSGAVQIKATQDIYSLPTTVYTETETGVDTRPLSEPVPAAAQLAFEAPHVDVVVALPRADLASLPEDVCFAVGAAGNPGDMLDFTLRVDAGAGFEDEATSDFCPVATLTAALPPGQQTDIAVSGTEVLGAVEIGSACIVGEEWCRVDAIDPIAGTIALGRGCADTVPAVHPAGTVIFFYAVAAAEDPTEYTDGETIGIKLPTRTGSALLADAATPTLPLTLARRRVRPYPPAVLKLNGVPIFDISTVAVLYRGGTP